MKKNKVDPGIEYLILILVLSCKTASSITIKE